MKLEGLPELNENQPIQVWAPNQDVGDGYFSRKLTLYHFRGQGKDKEGDFIKVINPLARFGGDSFADSSKREKLYLKDLKVVVALRYSNWPYI